MTAARRLDDVWRWLRGRGPAPNGAPVRLQFSARAVVGGAWGAPKEVAFGDAASAREFLLDLAAPEEPTLLRVEADVWGGALDDAWFAGLLGVWLLDADCPGPHRRLPGPPPHRRRIFWPYDMRGAEAWAERRDWLSLWEECPHPAWALFAAIRAGVRRELVIGACVACVRAAVSAAGSSEGHGAVLLREVGRALAGEPILVMPDLRAAYDFASLSDHGLLAERHLAFAAGDLATAAGLNEERGGRAVWLGAAFQVNIGHAALNATWALTEWGLPAGEAGLELAAAVRASLPTVEVLRAVLATPDEVEV